jgi:hypothetical protein
MGICDAMGGLAVDLELEELLIVGKIWLLNRVFGDTTTDLLCTLIGY